MIRYKLNILTLLMVLGLAAQQPVSHDAFDALLKKHVDDKGMVNYKGLKAERPELKSYLSALESNAPNSSWSQDEQLAYWINAYNAYTLDLILEHYPVKSIKDIGSLIKIPFVSTAWDVKFINIGGEEYDLNNIEHGIIRKEFDEPRIHFALVCAAVSCPKLQRSAFTGDNLEELLTEATKAFLADPEKNRFSNGRKAKLSKLFSWYGGDFKKETSLVGYLNQYAPVTLDEKASISWMDYNWALNEQ